MSFLKFKYMVLGQVLLNEDTYTGSYMPTNDVSLQQSGLMSPLQQSQDNPYPFSSFVTACRNDLCIDERRTPSAGCALHTIREDEETTEDGGANEEEEEWGCVFDASFLRIFKCCFLQFAYMMLLDKTPRSAPVPPP